MNHPVLTATVTCAVSVSPRDDLSLAQNVQVRVYRFGDTYLVAYTDMLGKPLSGTPSASPVPFRTPEDAMLRGVSDLFTNVTAHIRAAVECEPVNA